MKSEEVRRISAAGRNLHFFACGRGDGTSKAPSPTEMLAGCFFGRGWHCPSALMVDCRRLRLLGLAFSIAALLAAQKRLCRFCLLPFRAPCGTGKKKNRPMACFLFWSGLRGSLSCGKAIFVDPYNSILKSLKATDSFFPYISTSSENEERVPLASITHS